MFILCLGPDSCTERLGAMRIGAGFLITIGTAIALAGCNPVPPELRLSLGEPFTPDWCNAAKALPNDGGALTNVGRCHERGVPGFVQDRNVYVYYYIEGARRGHPDAGASLARLGEPIPDNDIQREAQARAERERALRALANALRPQVQQRPQPGFRPVTTVPRSAASPIPAGYSRSTNESVNERRVCTNNVCRTERTSCTNGVCSTTVTNN